jgi:hypothetical protein
MSAHGFKSVFMVASVAGAALGCYLVSLNVASERAKLEMVESKIVTTQRDIRLLQTEIGTRGRLAQLERWNANFIRLSAPNADQFLEGGFQLATMVKPAPKPVIEAPIVLASAPAEQGVARQAITSDDEEANTIPVVRSPPRMQQRAPSAEDMMHVASYEQPPKPSRPVGPAPPKASAAKGSKIAAADTLGPLPDAKPAAKASAPAIASATGSAPRKTKESGTPR